MGLRINQNIAAMNAYRNLTVTDGQMSKSLEKLSSGFRINRAADDAAGLSISEGLRAQVGGTKTAIRNAQEGISVVQTAEGALSEVHNILQRMRDLAVQASNTGSQDGNARGAAQLEITQLKAEIDRIGSTTSFGATNLLNGQFGTNQAYTGTANVAAGGADLTAIANRTFDVDFGGTVGSRTVTLGAANFASRADFVAELNRGIQAAYNAGGGTGSSTVSASLSTADSGATYQLRFTGDENFTGLANVHADVDQLITGAGVATGAATALGTGGVFQVGANNSAADRITVSIGQISTTAGDLSTLAAVDVSTGSGAQAAISTLSTAIQDVSDLRASLGAYQNRFEHTIANLSVAAENLSASESRIRDTDMAAEMVQFTRAQILTQAGTAMLAQANQAPQQVLQLLRG